MREWLRLAVACVCVWLCVCAASARVDELSSARCAAACTDAPKNITNQCEPKCNLEGREKPGLCPDKDSLAWFETVCGENCSLDRDCPVTDKCCPTECGRNCQHAVGLDTEPGLPSVPVDLTVVDTRRERGKLLRWSTAPGAGVVLYVLQERRCVAEGLQPPPEVAGRWRTRGRLRKSRYRLNGLVPAHWYQVRVAAVNANGTKGFSEPSQPFMISAEPKRPFEPRNLTVLRPGWVNGHLWAELRWKRPSSDLPLHHYKVFWSHCVKTELPEMDSSNTFCRTKSVIVNHKNVNYKNTNCVLKDLEPNSLYFIQVQAITIPYGSKKRLSSTKAVAFVDTNTLKNATHNWSMKAHNSVSNLHIFRYYRTVSGRLEASVTWRWRAASGRFLVSWAPHATCRAATNNPTFEAITEELQYDIDNLMYDCKYQVSVTVISNNKTIKHTFKTPLCSQVSSKLPCD